MKYKIVAVEDAHLREVNLKIFVMSVPAKGDWIRHVLFE